MQTQMIDNKKIRNIYNSSEQSKALFEEFSKKEHAVKFSTVDSLLQGTDYSRSQVIELLKGLSGTGVGTFKVGRRGQVSRMEWNAPIASIGKVALGILPEVQPFFVEDPGKGSPEPEKEKPKELAQPVKRRGRPLGAHNKVKVLTQGEWTNHSYLLRPNCKLTLRLPQDLTVGEAHRLSDFLQSLPFTQ